MKNYDFLLDFNRTHMYKPAFDQINRANSLAKRLYPDLDQNASINYEVVLMPKVIGLKSKVHLISLT